jgi:predicted TIM-barrel fold metal-dependent hydrolase
LIANARDCHAHVIEPARFPLWAGHAYEPPVATLDDYLALLDSHGFASGVLVQPSIYRFDNRCMLDALDRADGRLLGIAVPHPDSTTRDLENLHERGVRGVRCNAVNAGGLDVASITEWQPAMRALGWHVELHIALDSTPDPRALVDAFDLPVVIDHIGRPRIEDGIAAPSFTRLVDAVRVGACTVKLSAPYRMSHASQPWPDVSPFAHALLEANPAACLWASDWPHVDTDQGVDPAAVFATITEWLPTPALRQTVLSATPQRLFNQR